MQRARFLAGWVLLVVAMVALAACGSTTDDGGGGGGQAAGGGAAGGLPKLAQKDSYTVCFPQTEENNPWRLAQTASIKEEVQKRGWKLVYTNAAGSAAKQVADVQSCIAQKVDVIWLPPREEKPLATAVKSAKQAGIPVFLLDRNVDQSLAKAGEDYVAFIGSDFVEEGKRAAEWLIEETGGKANIIQLLGTSGASPANDRRKGFEDAIKGQSGMKILASQDGDFNRDKGRQVMETLLRAHPDVDAVYAHNDEMAIGAIAALKAAGRKPGQDVTLVSIDGERAALEAIVDGELGASVECNPRFGPKAAETTLAYAAGQTIPPKIINPDQFFDESNAKENIAAAY
jgi:galactofuranose transport system substrate-binding protein